ncbi:MAG TPA: M17 family peptidase N-terminal domain-containing protein, partial [Pseudobdellovibrionaceae bacterium]|nr:M17 family peptidase N-terminal domain-containing protein [Pseudobdellovibrionaceae bacterium]
MPKSDTKKKLVQHNIVKKLSLELVKGDISKASGHTLVLFARPGQSSGQSDKADIKVLNARLPENLLQACKEAGFAAAPKENFLFREIQFQGFRNLILVGLGKNKDDHEDIRQIFAALYLTLTKVGTSEVLVDLDGFVSGKKYDQLLKGAAEGILLANYDLTEFKSNAKDPSSMSICFVGSKASDKSLHNALQEAHKISAAVNFTRQLADTPANFMTPSLLADAAVQSLKGTGVKVEVWDKPRLKKERMGGILGVAQGSDQDPRFIIMDYRKGPKNQQPLVLVGKGLTFDCGGLNLKVAGSMIEEMKYDMC